MKANYFLKKFSQAKGLLTAIFVLLMFSSFVANAQSFSNNGPVCVGSSLTLTYSVGSCTLTTAVQFTGGNGPYTAVQGPPGTWTYTIGSAVSGDGATYTAVPTQTGTPCGTGLNTTAVVNDLPTITLGTMPTVCQGTTSANLPYSTTSGSPTTYSIVYDAAALSAGFLNVNDQALPSTPIVLVVPAAVAAGTYNGTLTVKNANGCVSIGHAITVTVEGPITNNTIAANQTICTGTIPALMTGSTPAGGNGVLYTYLWERSLNGSSGWLNAPGATFNQKDYTPTVALTTNYYYRRTVTSGACAASVSASILMTVQYEVSGNTITANQNICAATQPNLLNGSTPVGGDGVNYTYLWQESPDNGVTPWASATGTNNLKNYQPPVLSSTMYYRRQVTPVAPCLGTNSSASVQITVAPIPTPVLSGPVNICGYNSAATYQTAFVSGSQWTWYVQGWDSLGVDRSSTILFVSNGNSVNISWGPYVAHGQLRVKEYVQSITSCFTMTDWYDVYIVPGITRNTIAAPQTICSGSAPLLLTGSLPRYGGYYGAVALSICNYDANYTYLWEKSPNGTSGWSPADGINTGQDYQPPALTANTWYRRSVSTTGSCYETSATLKITVLAPIANNTITAAQTVCYNTQPLLLEGSDPTGGSGTYTYLWEESPDNLSWVPASEAAGLNTLIDYLPPALVTSTYYHRLVSSGACVNDPSSSLLITVQPLPTAEAGTGGTIGFCKTFTVTGSSTSFSSSVLWTEDGFGYMENPTSAAGAIYHPAAGDEGQDITLTLTASAIAPCTASSSDNVVIHIDPLPTADAGLGDNIGTCGGQTYQIAASSSGTGPLSYLWTGTASGYLSSTIIEDPIFDGAAAGPGTYTLTLKVTDTYGCTATDVVTITVDESPTAYAGSGATIGQCGKTHTFSDATATGTPTLTYLWTGAGLGTSFTLDDATILNPTYTSIGAGLYTLKLTVTDTYGCTATSSVNILVNVAPTANAGLDGHIGSCAGQTYPIAATTSGTGAEFLWTGTGSGNLSSTTVEDPIFDGEAAGPGTYTLTLTVTDDYGCTAADNVTIIVDATPTANAGIDGHIGSCAGQTYGIAATTSGTGAEFLWTGTGSGNLSSTTIEDPVFDGATAGQGTYTFVLTVTDDYGCIATDAVTIIVDDTPTANAGVDGHIGSCAGQTYAIAATTSGTGAEILWTGTGSGNLSSTTIEDPIFDGATAGSGTYNLTLTVTDDYGCTAADVVTIIVDATPTANAGSDGHIGSCAGQTYAITATTSGTGAEFLWTGVGSGILSSNTVEDPIFDGEAAGPGTYTLTLTVTDDYGCTATDIVTIIVDASPVASAGSDFTMGACSTQNLNSSLSTGTSITFAWSPATYLDDPTLASPLFTPSAGAGTYTYTLTVTDTYLCTSSDEITITVTGPTVDPGTDRTIGMCEQPIALAGSGTNDVTHVWSPATYLSDVNSYTPTFSGAPAGPHTYVLTVTDAFSCAVSAQVTITVMAAPVADAGTGTSLGECAGQTYDLDGTGSTGTGLAYSWSPITYLNGEQATATPTFGPAPDGTYVLVLTVTDDYGCISTDNVTVIVDPAPVADAGLGTSLGECAGQTYDLNGTLSTGTGLAYSWTPTTYLNGEEATATPTFEGAPDGTYVLVLTVTDDYGCISTANVTVIVDPAPTADAGPGATIGQCSKTYQIAAVVTGTTPITYLWTGTGTMGTDYTLSATNIEDPLFTSINAGTFDLTLKVTDQYGCTVSDYVTVIVDPNPTTSIVSTPSPFAPYEGQVTSYTLGTAYSSQVWGASLTPSGLFTSGVTPSFPVTWPMLDTPPQTGTVTVTVTDTYGCTASTSVTATLLPTKFAGQLKYWNSVETPMPSPFPTNYMGTPNVPDYFYVQLMESDDNGVTDPWAAFENGSSIPNGGEFWEEGIVKVEPRIEVGGELMSYFQFDHVNVSKTYKAHIWDGGYMYDQGTGELGRGYTWNKWGGVTATDALAINLMAAGTEMNNPLTYNYFWVGKLVNPSGVPYGYHSKSVADVNSSNTLTALDALTLSYRTVGIIPTLTNNTPNFRITGRFVPALPTMTGIYGDPNTPYYAGVARDVPFTKNALTQTADPLFYTWFTSAKDHYYYGSLNSYVNTSSTVPNFYLNVYYTATGDINSSYKPTATPFKADEAALALKYENETTVKKGEIVTIPVRIDRNVELGAITIGLTYRNDLIKVLDAGYEIQNINHKDGYVRVAWYDAQSRSFTNDDVIMNLKVMVLADFDASTRLFELENISEIADPMAVVIENASLKTVSLSTLKGEATDLVIANYPNPFNNVTTFTYTLPEAGKVELVVYNQLGQAVSTLVSEVQPAGIYTLEMNRANLKPGVYNYRIVLQGETGKYTHTQSMIIMQ